MPQLNKTWKIPERRTETMRTSPESEMCVLFLRGQPVGEGFVFGANNTQFGRTDLIEFAVRSARLREYRVGWSETSAAQGRLTRIFVRLAWVNHRHGHLPGEYSCLIESAELGRDSMNGNDGICVKLYLLLGITWGDRAVHLILWCEMGFIYLDVRPRRRIGYSIVWAMFILVFPRHCMSISSVV